MYLKKIKWFLLGILIGCWCLIPFCMTILQVCVQRYNWERVKQSKEKSDIEFIELSLIQFNQYKLNEKEILINQTLYDIVKYSIVEDKVFLQLDEDKEEQYILSILRNIVELIKFYLSNLFSALTLLPIFVFSSFVFYKLYEYNSIYYLFFEKICIDKIIPPPKILFV